MSGDKKKCRATASDVARAAGVSRSLVSRVYTKGASVSAKNRKLVREAALKLGYEPHIAARMLAGKASNVVGILVGPILNPFIASLLDKLTDQLRESGYLPMLFKIGTDGNLLTILPWISQYNMTSTIMVGVVPAVQVLHQFADKVPSLVILNLGTVRNTNANVITTDHFGGGMLAAQALLNGGSKRPAMVSLYPSRTVYSEREAGFRQVFEEADIAQITHNVAEGSHQAGFAATVELMTASEQPDAIFYGNDVMALGGLDALRLELGKSVPDDVTVIGYDDIENAQLGSYSLSTIRQPVDDLVAQAVSAVKGSDGEDAQQPAVKLLPPTFVERQTSRAQTNRK